MSLQALEAMKDEPLAARQACLHMVAHMLLADHVLTEEEEAYLHRTAAALTLADEEASAVLKRVDVHDSPHMLAAELPRRMRNVLPELLQQVAEVDGHVDPREAKLIRRVRTVVAIRDAHGGLAREGG